ncbi:MAG: glycosyltransferase family A protein [Candidatus Hodarchaeales archaeon]
MVKKSPKIVACFMAHDDDDYIDMVLEDLSKYVDEIYVNLNEPTPYIRKAVVNHPKVVKYIETKNNGRWNQGLQRDNTIRMLDDVKPDIVLFPDSDEIYPKNLKEQLEKFWQDEKKKTFWFRLIYLWDSEKTFRNDRLWKSIHHVRAYKWQPNITYLPKYAGYACPTTFIHLPKETRFHSDTPILHYGYMTEENRARKYARAGRDYIYDKEYRKMIDDKKLVKELPENLWP